MNGELLCYTSNEKVGPWPGPGPGPGPGPDPGPRPDPPGTPPNFNSLNEKNNMKINFTLGKGATFYSGIQKYDSSKNSSFVLKVSKFLICLISLIVLNI